MVFRISCMLHMCVHVCKCVLMGILWVCFFNESDNHNFMFLFCNSKMSFLVYLIFTGVVFFHSVLVCRSMTLHDTFVCVFLLRLRLKQLIPIFIWRALFVLVVVVFMKSVWISSVFLTFYACYVLVPFGLVSICVFPRAIILLWWSSWPSCCVQDIECTINGSSMSLCYPFFHV